MENVIFASEMIGAGRGVDPLSGHYHDDTKKYVDVLDYLSETERQLIFEGNARRVYPRLDQKLKSRGL